MVTVGVTCHPQSLGRRTFIAQRYVTGYDNVMAGARPPIRTRPLTGAERQARYCPAHQVPRPPPVVRFCKPADRHSRPERWRDALRAL